MQVIHGIPQGEMVRNSCLAMGNFDGVHRGHRQLIGRIVKRASTGKGKSVVITFSPHPSRVLGGNYPALLTTDDRKTSLIGELGVDYLVFMPFTTELAALEPASFVRDVLWSYFKPEVVAVGFNFTFGCWGSGTPELLQAMGKEMGFDVLIMPPVTYRGVVVSSTAIRNVLDKGEIPLAGALLGYWPVLEGIVIAGDQRGRRLGFPTANLSLPAEVKLPRSGVYACFAKVREHTYRAVVNIGHRPTVGDDLPAAVEAHIIDFEGDLYNREITLELRSFLRPEQRFNDFHELVEKVKEDKLRAQEILAREEKGMLPDYKTGRRNLLVEGNVE